MKKQIRNHFRFMWKVLSLELRVFYWNNYTCSVIVLIFVPLQRISRQDLLLSDQSTSVHPDNSKPILPSLSSTHSHRSTFGIHGSLLLCRLDVGQMEFLKSSQLVSRDTLSRFVWVAGMCVEKKVQDKSLFFRITDAFLLLWRSYLNTGPHSHQAPPPPYSAYDWFTWKVQEGIVYHCTIFV